MTELHTHTTSTNDAPRAPAAQAAAAATAQLTAQESLRSPGLNHFRKNPFRLFRLERGVSTTEALWKAEKTLALARAGLELPEADPLPWVPPADEVELQQAMQEIEEPMKRLVDELSWFDFAADPEGTGLIRAMEKGHIEFLNTFCDHLPEPQPGPLPQVIDGTPPVDPDAPHDRFLPVVARRMNRANLRLLIAMSELNGVAPRGGRARDKNAPPEVRWQELKGLRFINDAHALAPDSRTNVTDWSVQLAAGLADWAALLDNPQFTHALASRIRALGDDLLTADDAEAVTNALRTRFADMIAGEIKRAMVGGAVDRVGGLVDAAHKSGFDPKIWTLSFKPLRYLFETELSDLEGLIDGEKPTIEGAELYIQRLTALRKRWTKFDESGLLGLTEIVDDAVHRTFDRLREITISIGENDEAFKLALHHTAESATSESLKERIRAYGASFKDYTKFAICSFCKHRERDLNTSAVISGKKITGVTYGFNSRTTHYSICWIPIARCTQCADYHALLKKLDVWSYVAFIPAAVLMMVGMNAAKVPILGLVALGLAFTFGLVTSAAVREVIKKQMPAVAQKVDTYNHPAAVELRGDGYDIEKVDYSKDAYEQRKRRQGA